MKTIQHISLVICLTLLFISYILMIIFLKSLPSIQNRIKLLIFGGLAFAPCMSIFNYFLLNFKKIYAWVKFVMHGGTFLINIGSVLALIYLSINGNIQEINLIILIITSIISTIILGALLFFDIMKYRKRRYTSLIYTEI